MPPTCYLGLAATYHDPALSIVGPDGEVRFAEATERFYQNKRAFHCPPDPLVRMPELIREHCEPGAKLVLALSWQRRYLGPMRLMARASELATALGLPPERRGYTWPWPTARAQLKSMVRSIDHAGLNILGHRDIPNPVEIRTYDHHLTHAATACFTSPFSEAACAILDGQGGTQSCGYFRYADGELRSVRRLTDGIDLGSLGQFYALVCGLCGFDSVQGEEWKVMGLAAYGRRDPEWERRLRPMLQLRGMYLSQPRGQAWLDAVAALRQSARKPGEPAMAYADLAATGQAIFADVCRELFTKLHGRVGSNNLCFGGGCALNSSWNGRILAETPFEALHVPMAPGDDGNALGAALLAWKQDNPRSTARSDWRSPYLGSRLPARNLDQWARFGGAVERVSEGLHRRVAALLAEGKIVGWARGRAEFGPRSLGHRSILADPRPPGMTDLINSRVKFREQFRPLAPAILHERGPAWFEDYQEAPYMDRTLRFRPEQASRVPAVVHADGTGRVQSVTAEGSPDFYALLVEFERITGTPILLNTSFNVMGKPIIHSVEDALGVFSTSGLDVLVLEDRLLIKPG